MHAEQILALRHQLADVPATRGVHGDIKPVGGAALVLQGIVKSPTADIDASFAGYAAKTSVTTIVAGTATQYDLAPDWLNSNA
ncbi:MAG: hypothetical protein WBX27_07010 [Specibacter sp.]